MRLTAAVAAAAVALLCAAPAQAVVQCAYHTTAGCSLPRWAFSWSMAGSTYTYCFNACPLDWLANNTQLGRWAGVAGIDHYWTKQGMPCIDGIPQEFAMQDAFTNATKATFPGSRIMQYRITDAVPYAAVVHDAMVAHPEWFVRWHHAPNDNGSVCLMPYAEHGTTSYNCSWPIVAAAYDWTQPVVQQWYLDNIIKPTMVYGDGAWLDGDGPDNGAWMCSGNYNWGNLPAPYPALNESEVAAFCDGETAVVIAAQQWLIAAGGYEYDCIQFVNDAGSLPMPGDAPATCASKMTALAARQPTTAIALWGDRTASILYNASFAGEATAVFMLARQEHWLMVFPAENEPNATLAAYLLSDYGAPVGNMTQPSPNVFQRQFARANVTLDCNTYAATFATV